MLDFQSVAFGIKTLVDSYTFRYGEGSCQHSFVSSFCLKHKYGDMFCEKDGFLYTLRSSLCTDIERVYLFPHGDRTEIERAIHEVLNDAHEHNSRVKFETITQSAKDIVCSLFPEKFTVQSSQNYSEYVYSVERQLDIHNPGMRTPRQKINRFRRDYTDRFEITLINEDNIPLIREFQKEWLAQRIERAGSARFERQSAATDNIADLTCLDNFSALGLVGIIMFIDGKVCGYEFGAKLSDECMDSIAEKGFRNIRNICRVLNHEFITRCCRGMKWINCEEDIGIEGLRETKMLAHPEIIIDKYILTENE